MSKITHHVASAGARVRHVFVRDLDLMALIGIYDHEKVKPQRIVVNVDLSVQEVAGPMSDEIDHVVSYELRSRISFRMHEVWVWRLSGGGEGCVFEF
jgi:hypothetical protein